jgi:hypothetical protein
MSPMNAEHARLLVRPTVDTRFHIDFGWWEKAERDWEVYLRSHLCEQHRASYAELETSSMVDWVDPVTAEVTRVPGIQHTVISHCTRLPDYITPQTTLVDAVFRVFLANGNTPLSATKLGERLGRPAPTILKTLSGPRVYKGIRPYTED